MAILMMIEFGGTTVEQYDRVNEILGIRGDEDAPDGLLSHTCSVDGDGLVIVDVWESEGQLQRFVDERLGAALREAGVPQAQPRILPVHNSLGVAAAV